MSRPQMRITLLGNTLTHAKKQIAILKCMNPFLLCEATMGNFETCVTSMLCKIFSMNAVHFLVRSGGTVEEPTTVNVNHPFVVETVILLGAEARGVLGESWGSGT